MNGDWKKRVGEPTLEFLRQARKALGDDLWWAAVADGASCGDEAVAARCVELGVRVSRAALGSRDAGSSAGLNIDDAMALIASGVSGAMVLGARCVRHIADLVPAERERVVPAFRGVTARAREVLVGMVPRRGDDELSTQLIVAGLRDRSRRVRLAAVYAMEGSDSPDALAELRRVMVTERDPELVEVTRRVESKVAKGYWIGPAAYGACDVELRLDIGGSIPVATFEEFGEEAVMRRFQRYARGVASPTFTEDEAWFGWQKDRWRASPEFEAFRMSVDKQIKDESSRSDQGKRAALVAQLKGAESGFVEAAAFLDGSEDVGSIGCNLDPHPGLGAFRRVVKRLAKRSDVAGLFAEVKEAMEAPAWPFTDSVLVCTSAGVKDVERWFRALRPDSVTSGDGPGPAPNGFRWLLIWWD